MRILLAGTHSGCGKTTASLLLMAALTESGLSVAPYKVGPDYIDPGFHRAICGRPSHNLDTHLMAEPTIRRLLRHEADIAVIEGVMGYYDGLDTRSLRTSTWEIARLTQTPVLLVVDASGGAASVAAQVKGFQCLREDSGLAGVLVNRVSGEHHYRLVEEAVAYYTGLPCVGYIRKNAAPQLASRHLGLVPAAETADVRLRVLEAARQAADTLDLAAVRALASQAPELAAMAQPKPPRRPLRLGLALDEAFHFYYEANLQYLRDMGMTLVPFSPLHDASVPQGLDGLYIGGGFPEVFAQALTDNVSMRTDLRRALEAGLACYAECGGLMYLSDAIDGHAMVGFLPAACSMTDRLQRFGYVYVEDRTGLTFPAHEFHYAAITPGPDARCAYTVRKARNPDITWACGYERGHTLGAFAHLHFADRPELVARLWP